MTRILGLAFLLALAGSSQGIPISVGGWGLGEQTFQWNASYSQRHQGSYGQYEVALTAGKTYAIYTFFSKPITTLDPYLYVLDPTTGGVVAQDDNSGQGNEALIYFTPSETKTYWVRLRSSAKGKSGRCYLRIERFPTAPPQPSAEQQIGPWAHLHLSQEVFQWKKAYSQRWQGEYGQYKVYMASGVRYRFDADLAGLIAGDPRRSMMLYLLNPSLQFVSQSGETGSGNHAEVTYTAPVGGWYHLRLRAFHRGTWGRCSLSVTCVTEWDGSPLQPDVVPWVNAQYLKDASISWESGMKRLRFSNAVANRGEGVLSLFGAVNSASGMTDIFQSVDLEGGESQNVFVTHAFNPDHKDHPHWHMRDFVGYELRKDFLGGELVATTVFECLDPFSPTGLLAPCISDNVPYTDETIEDAPPGPVKSCANQGVSRGWAQVTVKTAPDQWLNITNVPNGKYVLVTIADPHGWLMESFSDRMNNVKYVTLTITGNWVTVE